MENWNDPETGYRYPPPAGFSRPLVTYNAPGTADIPSPANPFDDAGCQRCCLNVKTCCFVLLLCSDHICVGVHCQLLNTHVQNLFALGFSLRLLLLHPKRSQLEHKFVRQKPKLLRPDFLRASHGIHSITRSYSLNRTS